jgi:hypothetical protein
MTSVEQSVEWESAGETEVPGENLPQCHCPPQIPYDLTWARTLAMARPTWKLTYSHFTLGIKWTWHHKSKRKFKWRFVCNDSIRGGRPGLKSWQEQVKSPVPLSHPDVSDVRASYPVDINLLTSNTILESRQRLSYKPSSHDFYAQQEICLHQLISLPNCIPYGSFLVREIEKHTKGELHDMYPGHGTESAEMDSLRSTYGSNNVKGTERDL